MPFSPSRRRAVRRRINTETRNFTLDKILQKVSIIAADFDNKRTRPKLELSNRVGNKTPRVLKPGIRERRKVHIVSMKMDVGRFMLLDLNKPARIAGIKLQGI